MLKTIYVLVKIKVENPPEVRQLDYTGYLRCDNLKLESFHKGIRFEESVVSWETIKFGETPNSF